MGAQTVSTLHHTATAFTQLLRNTRRHRKKSLMIPVFCRQFAFHPTRLIKLLFAMITTTKTQTAQALFPPPQSIPTQLPRKTPRRAVSSVG